MISSGSDLFGIQDAVAERFDGLLVEPSAAHAGVRASFTNTSVADMGNIEVRLLSPSDIELLHRIDRTEQLEVEYRVENGKLVSSDSTLEVPPWDTTGSGDHSVSRLVAFCEPHLDEGAQLLGAFRAGAIVGMALVESTLRPEVGWLALLHVSNGQRRGGVGQALWRAAVSIVEDSGGETIYVSATPTGSAVQFYLKQGCRLAEADEIVPELFDAEPDDIHLVCPLSPSQSSLGKT